MRRELSPAEKVAGAAMSEMHRRIHKPIAIIIVDGNGDRRPVVVTNDDAHIDKFLEAIRGVAAIASIDTTLSSPLDTSVPLATNGPDVMADCFGMILGVIDMARSLTPPPTTSPRDALRLFTNELDAFMKAQYGEQKWLRFVDGVRATALKQHRENTPRTN